MPAYNRQLEDEDGNIIYPIVNSDSIQNNSITASKIDSTTLWTNPNALTTNFSGQNIDMSDSFANYDHCIIIWKQATTDDSLQGTIFYPNLGYGIVLSYSNGSVNRAGSREFSYVSTTRLSVGDGFYNGSLNNAAVIPYKIIGYK